MKRNTDLTPTPVEQTDLVNMVSKVSIVLENLALTPGNFDACQIDEVRQVGSFKKGTMITKRNKADIVVILKTLPIVEAIKALGSRVLEDMFKMDPSTTNALKVETVEVGFEITNTVKCCTARILITTIMPNFRKIDNSIHMSVKLLQRHMSAIRHVRWFEETANLTTIKVLIRVLRDICERYKGLNCLTPWMIDVLAHYAVTFRKSQQLLPLNNAFKRVFQLLAAGLFLAGSTGIPDPCQSGATTMHSPLSLIQQDSVCMTAQTLLRVLSYPDGLKVILGLEEDPLQNAGGFTDNMSVWGGIVVVPSNAAFELVQKDEHIEKKNPVTIVDEAATTKSIA